MYKDIIEIKKDTPKEILEKIKNICIEAHKNRAGEVKLTPISEYSFCFQGTEKDYPCLQLGYLALDDSKLFLDKLSRGNGKMRSRVKTVTFSLNLHALFFHSYR